MCLHQLVQVVAANHGNTLVARLQRHGFFISIRLAHVQISPYYIRLFRPEKKRHERLVNPISYGPVGRLTMGYLNHFSFSKHGTHWLEQHNSYSRFKARQILDKPRGQTAFSLRRAFAAADFHERRFHQKELLYRQPLRPLLKCVPLSMAKGGFLEGRAGLTCAVLQSIYEYMIVLKVQELECVP